MELKKDVATQKRVMNLMLDYLEANCFSIEWDREEGYCHIKLSYSKEDSLLRKLVVTRKRNGLIDRIVNKEKAFGGSNSEKLIKELIIRVKNKAKKSVGETNINKELSAFDIFLEEILED